MEMVPVSPAPSASAAPPARAGDEKPFSIFGFQPFGNDGPTFYDMLDIVNPLQHLPIVSYVYREVTGDEIDPMPRVAGGALFGGLYGAIGSLVNMVVDEVTGDDIGGHAIALFKQATNLDEGPAGDEVLLADNTEALEDFETSAGQSPVKEYLNVLEWAQRETEWQLAARVAAMETAGGPARADSRPDQAAPPLFKPTPPNSDDLGLGLLKNADFEASYDIVA
jgi:hypothetical protein